MSDASIPVPATTRTAAPSPAAHGSPAAAVSVPASRASSRRADEREVCGLGVVRVRDDVDDPYPPKASEAGRERLLARMRTSTDERTRAAAQLWASAYAPAPGWAPPSSLPSQQGLVDMALRTGDPVVYGFAYAACSLDAPAEPESACAQLEARRWASLEPDNGVPWAQVLEEALRINDSSGVEEALNRLATAQGFDAHWARAAESAAQIVDATADDLTRSTEALVVRDLGEVSPLSPYEGLHRACDVPSLADPNRRAPCDRIAERLVTGASVGALERFTGIAMGRRLGWPEQRLLRLRDETNALLAPSGMLDEHLDRSCAGNARLRERTALRARPGGDLAVGRDWLQRHGVTVEQEIARQRAQREAEAAHAGGASGSPGADVAVPPR